MKVVNLSRRPFLNSRPVVRLATLLWLVGGSLLGANLWSYRSNAEKFADSQHELQKIDEKIRHDQEEIRQLDKELSALAIVEQNDQVAYLNTLIAHRTFPWSLLFEQLEAILPQDVRLVQVRPEIQLASLPGVRRTRTEDDSRSRRTRRAGAAQRSAPTSDQVQLQITGVARSDDPLLDFIDALFASPHFDKPVLHQENRETTGDLRFRLDVLYLLTPSETETTTPAPDVVLGAAEDRQPEAKPAAGGESAAVAAATANKVPDTNAPENAERTAPETALETRTGAFAPPAQLGTPTLRREPGAPEPPPPVVTGERPVYLSPSQKRRLEAEAAARAGERDGGSAATTPAGVVFGTPVQPVQPSDGASPTSAPTSAPTKTAEPDTPAASAAPGRQRPTLERPRLGPSPTNLAPEASASPRLRRGGRP